MRGGEIFTVQVLDPVTEFVVTRRDKDTLLTVKVMADREGGVADVAVVREVWEI